LPGRIDDALPAHHNNTLVQENLMAFCPGESPTVKKLKKEITMNLRTNRIRLPLVAALALCLAGALSIAVPQQVPPGQRGPAQPPDPLRQLNNALQQAGAPLLTEDQAKQILAIIEDFRTSTRPAPPSSVVQQARLNYETAILNGDLAAATVQIPTLVGEQTANAPVRMQGEAALAINVLKVLRTNADQLALLQKSMNRSQLVRLLQSFAGGGGAGQGPVKK
jgi:hypothetical protein